MKTDIALIDTTTCNTQPTESMVLFTRKVKLQNNYRKKKSIFILFSFKIIDAIKKIT